MAEFLNDERRQPDAAVVDAAVIRVDQLHALAGLLSLEEVAEQFSGMPTTAQVALFGLFEAGLGAVRATLAESPEVSRG